MGRSRMVSCGVACSMSGSMASGEKFALRQIDPQGHMSGGRIGAGIHAAHDAGDQTGNVETEGEQSGAQQGVVLETIAAPAVDDDLLLQRRRVQLRRAAKQHVEIFERDGGCLGEDDAAQGFEGRRPRAFIPDALQPGCKIEVAIWHGTNSPAKDI